MRSGEAHVALFRRVLRRLGGLAFTLFGATLVTFAISHLVPTDVARLVAGDHASPAVVEHIRHSLGLDRPVWVQYAIYLRQLLHGDLGTSIRSGAPVLGEIAGAAGATAELAVYALLLIAAASLILGSLAARYHNRWIDQVVRLSSALALSLPTFWSGLLLIGVFAAWANWAPSGGRLDPDLAGVTPLTGFVTLDALAAGRLDVFLDALAHLALPAITLALISIGGMTRLLRASLLEVRGSTYVLRARSAGLSEWTILTRYALPNALIPFVTSLGLVFADLLGGAVVTEILFGWPGLGSYTMQAIAGLDFPAIMGFTLFVAAAYAVANLLVDLLCTVLDPRTRTS